MSALEGASESGGTKAADGKFPGPQGRIAVSHEASGVAQLFQREPVS